MENNMDNKMHEDIIYSEYDYNILREDQRAMEEDYILGELAVDDWNIRYEDWSDEDYDKIPF
jgi:hypothetical protein